MLPSASTQAEPDHTQPTYSWAVAAGAAAVAAVVLPEETGSSICTKESNILLLKLDKKY